MALFALSIAASPAAAASTFEWSLDCNGNSIAHASWTWTVDGVSIGYGGVSCENDESSADSGAARPDGANGVTVTVFVASRCSEMRWRTVSESFSIDGSFKVKVTVSLTEISKGSPCPGHYHEHAALSISG